MEPHQLLQKLHAAAGKAAERASDLSDAAKMSADSAASAQRYAGAALSLTQAAVTLQAGSNGRR